MSPSAPSQMGSDVVLAEVIEEFTNRLQAGESIDVESYVRKHPEHAERLRQLLPALVLLDDLSRSQSSANGAGAESREGTLCGTLGDFRIVREVGRGGMGVVYEAEQISLRRRVALKVLPFAATMDPRHLQRFHNEAQAAACLHHTNIVPVYFVGSERSVHFYAMQFIDGQPLSEILRQLRRVEKESPADAASTVPAAAITPLTGEGRRSRDYFRKVAELGIQAAEALDHAHQLGIVHRDIKPANLLLDGRGNVWVTDFGLAHVQHGEANLTLTGQAVGTPRYMSPEQALAKRVPLDHRTDVYSLGATLYELLTLRPAFASDDRQELLRQIAFEEPPPPRRLERAIPAELEIIVLKAMEKRPQDRYATAQELADDLERWSKHEPIRARRPSLVQRASKWVRRHKPAFTAGVVVLFMALMLAGYITWTHHDRALRRAANAQVILAALKDSQRWQEKRRLPEALSSARRAEGLLAGADVNETLRQQVRTRLADLELVADLENIRVEQGTAVVGGHFDEAGEAALYGRFFREAGLDVETLPPEEVGEQIARSTVAVELAAILDNWVVSCQRSRGWNDPSWRKLLGVARVADPDPLRARVRDRLEKRDRQALRELVSSKEVFRLPQATLAVVGWLLRRDEETHRSAELFLREAQRRYPDDFWLNHNLFKFYRTLQPPQREKALPFAAMAVALRPDSPAAHGNYGNALKDKGWLDEAVAEYREVIRLKPDDALGHNNLGTGLEAQGRHDEAIAEYRKAIRLDPSSHLARVNLGNELLKKGLRDEAITEYRKALGLNKNFPEAHYNLGTALRDQGQLDEAIAEYHEAIRLKPDYAEPHCNLGDILLTSGRFKDAVKFIRRGHALGSRNPGWRYPSDQWLRKAEQMANLDDRLSSVLTGKGRPKDAGERLALAQMCQLPCKKQYTDAVRLFRDAFAEEPKLADDLVNQHRYNAACAATLAGCGQGKDADKLDTKERARLHQQALDWLRADLKVYQRDMEKIADKAGPAIAQRMQHWVQDGDFARVRGDEALAKLPESERNEWQKLWQEVEALRQRAAQSPKAKSSARP